MRPLLKTMFYPVRKRLDIAADHSGFHYCSLIEYRGLIACREQPRAISCTYVVRLNVRVLGPQEVKLATIHISVLRQWHATSALYVIRSSCTKPKQDFQRFEIL